MARNGLLTDDAAEPQLEALRGEANRHAVNGVKPMSIPSAPAKRAASDWVPLLQEVIRAEGHCRWPLRGDSMHPTLPADCEIDVVPLPPRVPLGSLVVFASGDALVAHRLVRRAGGKWTVQGDNRRSPDGALDPAQVLGLVGAAYTADQRRCWPPPFSGALARFWVTRYHVYWVARSAMRSVRRLFAG